MAARTPAFVLKTEPSEYSFADLVRDGTTTWTGVSNPAALANIRAARKGDLALIYHTGDEKAIAGLAEIVSDPHADPKKPGTNARGEIKFAVFDIRALRAAPKPVTLAALKADPRFADFALVRQPRLSVVAIPAALRASLLKLCGL